jgi:Ni/Fe-hydrogenase subunit HybB-like protein
MVLIDVISQVFTAINFHIVVFWVEVKMEAARPSEKLIS